MNYDVICSNCKECKGENIKIVITKSNDKMFSDLTTIKCINYERKEIPTKGRRI